MLTLDWFSIFPFINFHNGIASFQGIHFQFWFKAIPHSSSTDIRILNVSEIIRQKSEFGGIRI